jgi:phosphatidylserine/phosphatidylglycerophosphate/cardiolipin synthase-like enzyme
VADVLEALLPLLMRLSAELTQANMGRLLEVLGDAAPNVVERVTGLAAAIRQREQRALVAALASTWRPIENNVTAPEVRGALVAACHLAQAVHRAEIVWTGPEGVACTFRRTEQVVVDMLAGARNEVLLVTYNAYDISELAVHLQSLARHKVHVSAVLELLDPRTGDPRLGPLRAMGREFADLADIYYWPVDKRPSGEGRACGVLHVKCLVVDRMSILITSANLTKSALTLNMEMGLLVHDEALAGRVADYFDELIRVGVLAHLGQMP